MPCSTNSALQVLPIARIEPNSVHGGVYPLRVVPTRIVESDFAVCGLKHRFPPDFSVLPDEDGTVQSKTTSSRLPQAIGRHVVMRVFRNVDLDQITGSIKQIPTLLAEMSQMQSLPGCFVFVRHGVNGFQA